MNQDQIEEISKLPFIKRFVYESMKFVREEGIKLNEKSILHADLVPKVSEKVMMASMMERKIPPRRILSPEIIPNYPKIEREKSKINPQIIAPIPTKQIIVQRPPTRIEQKVVPQNKIFPQEQFNKEVEITGDYGKINHFLREKTISFIECPGPGKSIIIIKMGQRQMTNITLNPKEIRMILDEVAAEAHIPLLEGVFRAAVGGFTISAVISEIIGSKFVIKKSTPYAMLEGRP
jgi:hypothetical protein